MFNKKTFMELGLSKFLDWIYGKDNIVFYYIYNGDNFTCDIIEKILFKDLISESSFVLNCPQNKSQNQIFLRIVRKVLFEINKKQIIGYDIKKFLDYIPGKFNNNSEIFDYKLLNSIINDEKEVENIDIDLIINGTLNLIKILDKTQMKLYKKILVPCIFLFSDIERNGLPSKYGTKRYVYYNLSGTVSGRLTCESFSAKNIFNPINLSASERDIIKAPDGYSFINSDYNAMEMRILGYVSDDKRLNYIFKNNYDIYEVVSECILNSDRKTAKNFCFIIIYGGGEYAISNLLNISMEESNSLMCKFYEMFPGVEAWTINNQIKALEKGEIRSLFGRIRKFKNLNDNKVLRQCRNFEIQSIANDISLLSLIEINEKILDDSNILISLHDENLVMSPKSKIDGNIEIIKNIMKNPSKLSLFGIDNIELNPILKVTQSWE